MQVATYPVGRALVDVGALLDEVLHGLGGARAVLGHAVQDQVVQDGLVAGREVNLGMLSLLAFF